MSPARSAGRFLFILLSLGCLLPMESRAAMVLTGTAGVNSGNHFKGAHFAYSGALYAKFDDMTLLGIQSGQGTVAGSKAIPLLGSAIIRLPIGRIVMPVATGDIGYAFDEDHPGFIWRGGGGFDIRNGRHSSILALGGFESQGSRAGWLGRLGLLLEF